MKSKDTLITVNTSNAILDEIEIIAEDREISRDELICEIMELYVQYYDSINDVNTVVFTDDFDTELEED